MPEEIVEEECIETAPQSELSEFFAVPGLRTLPMAPTGGSSIGIYGNYSISSDRFVETMDSGETIYFQNASRPIRSSNREPINDMPTTSSPLAPGFTDETIRAWADGRMCSITAGSERHVIEALARIIVREVL